jgi:hypothetical protein
MPTYNRPQYLVQTLEALSHCIGLERFQIVTSEEPGQPENSAVFEEWLPKLGIPFTRNVNEKQMGCSLNLEASFERGFATGSEWMISLEEDVVLAKDALLFLEWAVNTYWDEERIMGASTFFPQAEDFEYELEDLKRTSLGSQQFYPWGCAINRARFLEMKPCFKKSVEAGFTWDMFISLHMAPNCCMQVIPQVSRNQNVGQSGQGADYDFWKENHYVNNYVGELYPDYPVPAAYDLITKDIREKFDRGYILGEAKQELKVRPWKTESQ